MIFIIIEERIINTANYIVDTGATVRNTAKVFGVSKSTIHKNMTEDLERINKNLYNAVRVILDKNLRERHIRGGEATKQKYKKAQ